MRQSETALAFTADGHLYRKIQRQPNLQVLAQATSEWKDIGPGPIGKLWGADGKALVFSLNEREGPIVLEWFKQPLPESTQ